MFMQQFVYAPAALQLLSQHVESGQTLPTHIVNKLLGAKTLLAGWGNSRYIAMCKYDLAMHGELPLELGGNEGGGTGSAGRKKRKAEATEGQEGGGVGGGAHRARPGRGRGECIGESDN